VGGWVDLRGILRLGVGEKRARCVRWEMGWWAEGGFFFFADLALVVCGQWRVGEGGMALVCCAVVWCLYPCRGAIAVEMVVVGIGITGYNGGH
jgi:hypothetical protein